MIFNGDSCIGFALRAPRLVLSAIGLLGALLLKDALSRPQSRARAQGLAP
jgi:hypothetical protein